MIYQMLKGILSQSTDPLTGQSIALQLYTFDLSLNVRVITIYIGLTILIHLLTTYLIMARL